MNPLRFVVISTASGLCLFGSQPITAATTFDYTLPPSHRPYWTSAGVFKPDGTLVRTLWSKEIRPAGSYSASWNELDDEATAAPAGSYEIRVLHHQMDYVWDGTIGNTSAEVSGAGTHGCFYPMQDMCIGSGQGFYVSGYNEAWYSFHSFNPAAASRATDHFLWRQFFNSPTGPGFIQKLPADISDRSWHFTATDGQWVYFACTSSTDPTAPYPRGNQHWNTYKGFVVACDAQTHAHVNFTNGQMIPNGGLQRQDNGGGNYTYYEGNPYNPFPNGVYAGTQPGLSGMAVQTSGNVLALAVAPDNAVYLLDKRSGASLGTITVPAPGRMEFNSAGDLWVCSANSVILYTGLPGTPSISTTISGLVKPLDVAVHPSLAQVLIADGGSSQQVKAFTSSGAPLWTLGQSGGQPAHGVEVQDDVFWFIDGKFDDYSQPFRESAFLAFDADGSFWVSDGGNWRVQHFSPGRQLQESSAWQPHHYSCSVDANNPTRVFSCLLEYEIDYSKPLKQGWKLKRNWAATRGPEYHGGTYPGLRCVTTLSNGRTYATVARRLGPSVLQYWIEELTASGLRTTTTQILNEMMAPNGDLRSLPNNNATWTQRVLTGFSGAGDPQYASSTALASAPNGPLDPVPYCCTAGSRRTPVTSTNILVSFDPVDSVSAIHGNFHLGGIRTGTTQWLWRASPAVMALDNRGGFEVSTSSLAYAGNAALAAGRHIVYGYHGEGFRNQSQACQFMHWWDDGLFLGQFGEARLNYGAWAGKIPGSAGNGINPELVIAPNGELYLYANDENANGLQRWHMAGAQSITELSGQVTLGGSVTLTGSTPAAPSVLQILPGNGRATLMWSPVAGALSYRIRHSATDGGPYLDTMDVSGATSATIADLPNGQPRYFVVSAIAGSGEGPSSAQARTQPFNTMLPIQTAGNHLSGLNSMIFKIDTTAPGAGRSPVVAQVLATGDTSWPEVMHRAGSSGHLALWDFGKQGYSFFNYSGTGADVTQALSSFSVTRPAVNWVNDERFIFRFDIDGVAQTKPWGVRTTTSATVQINASNNGPADWHCLTVAAPRQSAGARDYSLRLTPQGQSSPVADYTVSEGTNSSNSTLVQYYFQGPVTLTLQKNAAATSAYVQGIFLDDVPITQSLSALESWKATYLGNSQASDLADGEHDALPALLEYAVGLSPVASDSLANVLTAGSITVGQQSFLTLTFPRDPSRNDIDYIAEVSGDLENWTAVASSTRGAPVTGVGYVSGDSPGTGIKYPLVRDLVPSSSSQSRFIRLKIRR